MRQEEKKEAVGKHRREKEGDKEFRSKEIKGKKLVKSSQVELKRVEQSRAAHRSWDIYNASNAFYF